MTQTGNGSAGRWRAKRRGNSEGYRIAPARSASLPRNTKAPGETILTSVSCGAPGSCVAVGNYGTHVAHAIIEIERPGKWQRAISPAVPASTGRSRPRERLALATPRLPRAPAPKSQTPTLVAPLLGDLGFPATPEDQSRHSPRRGLFALCLVGLFFP